MKPPSFKQKNITLDGTQVATDVVAAANWLLDHGAQVTIAGVRSDAERVRLTKHIDDHLKRTARDGKAYAQASARLLWSSRGRANALPIATLFVQAWGKHAIAITGVIGKSTTAVWAAHLAGNAIAAGHVPERPLMSALGSRAQWAFFPSHDRAPACTTVCMDDAEMYLPELSVQAIDVDAVRSQWGAHAVANLAVAAHAARIAGASWQQICKQVATLPQLPHRQQEIARDSRLRVIDDRLAHSLEAGIAAVRRFGGPTCILIAGGAGSVKKARAWAQAVRATLRRTNILFVEGVGTRALRRSLGVGGRGTRAYPTYAAALEAARRRARVYVTAVILYSPAVEVE